MNETLFSSDTNSATNSPNFQNAILYKKLFNVELSRSDESNDEQIDENRKKNEINNDHNSTNDKNLQFFNNENSSSIYGYDATSTIQRNCDMYPYETCTQTISNEFNTQMMDSLSTLSERKKRIIVRIVTIFSIILFLICFGMIALTLRMSEKIDAQSNFFFF